MTTKDKEPDDPWVATIVIVIVLVVLMGVVVGLVFWDDMFDRELQGTRKTPAALDINDCNSTPREDGTCKCIEPAREVRWVYNYMRLRERNVSIEDFAYIAYLNLSDVSVECRNPPIQDCFIYEETGRCADARPKTECEKGNPDWVEERINTICDGKAIYINDDETGETIKTIDKSNECYQTICRAKIEAEKGGKDWCKIATEWVEYWKELVANGTCQIDCGEAIRANEEWAESACGRSI